MPSKIDATIAIQDRGMFQPLAHRLCREFKRVLYFRDWKTDSPTTRERRVGQGYEFESIPNLEDYEDEIDLYCFPGLYDEPVQARLRREGKAVWGAGDGAFLELDREFLLETMEEVGLPVPKWEIVVGVTNLRAYLKDNPGVYVKVSYDRGLTETFLSIDAKRSASDLLSIEYALYPFQEDQKFVVVKKIEGKNLVETGYDGYFVGGFPKTALLGCEDKDSSYMQTALPYADLPKQVKMVNEKLTPVLLELGCQGMIFTEILGDVLLDITARHATPAGECLQELCGNLGQVIFDGANGRLAQMEISHRYAAQVILKSDQLRKLPLEIKIPENTRQYVKLYNSTFHNGTDVVLPMPSIAEYAGSVVGVGNTPNEAQAHCLSIAEGLKGNGLKWDEDALEKSKNNLLTLLKGVR
jgi:hypothetical protein